MGDAHHQTHKGIGGGLGDGEPCVGGVDPLGIGGKAPALRILLGEGLDDPLSVEGVGEQGVHPGAVDPGGVVHAPDDPHDQHIADHDHRYGDQNDDREPPVD